MLEDLRLIARLKKGKADALEQIYNKYEKDVFRLAANLLGDPNLAEDVLQDVFMKFIGSIDRFRLTGSLRGYLAKCAVNRVRDYQRKTKVRAAQSELPRTIKSDAPGPLQKIMDKEQQEQIGAALAKLPYEQREVVVLHLQANQTFRQVAKLQNVPVKTVESRYRYGLNRLQSILDDQV